MSRRRPAAVVAVLAAAGAIVVAGPAPAGADSPPTLAASVQHLSDVGSAIAADVQLLRTQEARARADARALGAAADRVARLGSRIPWASTPEEATRLRARLRAASATLRRVQARAASQAALPRAFALDRRLRRLRAERSALGRLVATLQAATPAPVPTGVTRGMWAVTFLKAAGAPVCANNLESLVAWQTAESTGAAWNPLATTLSAPGATRYNSAGVKNYPSLLDGVNATIATLRGGWTSQGYGWILYRLSQCADPRVTAAAVNASNWCRACANGAYVVDALPLVEDDYEGYAER